MSPNEDNKALVETKEFLYCMGIALGIMLGFALGYWTSYSNSIKYAEQALYDYMSKAPVDCQIAMGYGNSSRVTMDMPTIQIQENGKVTWKPQPN